MEGEEEKEETHHDDGRKQISMERVELPQLHEHPLIPFNRFVSSRCGVCHPVFDDYTADNGDNIYLCVYIYGGYRCNELGV